MKVSIILDYYFVLGLPMRNCGVAFFPSDCMMNNGHGAELVLDSIRLRHVHHLGNNEPRSERMTGEAEQ